MNKKDLLVEFLQSLDSEKLFYIHNEVIQENGFYDDELFYNDEDFFNTYFENKVMEAVRSCHYGDYNYNDEYIKFDGYGNLETFSGYEIHDYILFDEIADYMIDNEDYSVLENNDLLDDFNDFLQEHDFIEDEEETEE